MATFRKSFEEILAAQNATAPRRKPRDDEHRLQCACVKWFNLQYPHLRGLLIHPANGEYRLKATAGRLKAAGVVAGVADLILFVPQCATPFNLYHGLCIELKTKTGRQSQEQKAWQEKVEKKGYKYIIVRSFDEFKDEIERYLRG